MDGLVSPTSASSSSSFSTSPVPVTSLVLDKEFLSDAYARRVLGLVALFLDSSRMSHPPQNDRSSWPRRWTQPMAQALACNYKPGHPKCRIESMVAEKTRVDIRMQRIVKWARWHLFLWSPRVEFREKRGSLGNIVADFNGASGTDSLRLIVSLFRFFPYRKCISLRPLYRTSQLQCSP